MTLDPELQRLLQRQIASGARPLHQMSAAEARLARADPEPVGDDPSLLVDERLIPGPGGDLPLRLYVPAGQRPLPALVWFHGGSWVVGGLNRNDAFCRELARSAGCLVVSVDYRLAPEHKFPAAVEDCYEATRWLAENAVALSADPTRLAVAGSSAGGNLAAAVALVARDRHGPQLVHQVLIYPVCDHGSDLPSQRECGEGFGLGRADIAWAWHNYLGEDADGTHPYASPLRAPDLAGLPSACVITAEYDPIRDEGEAYAARLIEGGVRVRRARYEGVNHGFLNSAPRLRQSVAAQALIVASLQEAFAASCCQTNVGLAEFRVDP
jgi:acetyl esterase